MSSLYVVDTGDLNCPHKDGIAYSTLLMDPPIEQWQCPCGRIVRRNTPNRKSAITMPRIKYPTNGQVESLMNRLENAEHDHRNDTNLPGILSAIFLEWYNDI